MIGWLACGALAIGGELTRGPFLQQGTAGSVVVCWRSSEAGAGVVRYGPAPDNLPYSAAGPSATDHRVLLGGLQPATAYYYAVETSGETLAQGSTCRFVTATPEGSKAKRRIWVLGDCGTGSSEQIAVRDGFYQLHQTHPADAVVLLGDNAYYAGTDADYQLNFFGIYEQILRQVPVWPCYGNHETYGEHFADGTYAYDSIFAVPKQGECGGAASGTTRYYAWNHGNLHFIMLDSMTSSRAATGPMAQWLAADLTSNTLPWVVVCFHHPPYTKGSHDSDEEGELIEMREQILPILEGHGVDLVLSGHSHSYERSALIDGHYGDSDTLQTTHFKDMGDGREDGDGAYRKLAEHASPHEGAVYMVAGSAGQRSGGALNHPVMKVSLDELGSVVLDVTDNRMDVTFLRELPEGGGPPATDDHFTMIKGALAPPVQPGTGSLLALPAGTGVVHWEDLSDNESGFRVELSQNSGPFALAGEFPAGRRWCDLSGMAAGTALRVRVTAFNARGDSPVTETQFTWPAAPSSVSALDVARFRHFGVTASSGDAADLADPDHDGSPTLLELGLGGDPRDPDSLEGLECGRDGSARFIASFSRQAMPELTYRVQFCGDLAAASWTTVFESTGPQNNAGKVTVTDPAGPGLVRRFARVSVSRTP
ncbi:metallophosphoesterase [Luteolibacter sp. Y139]|uniref:Metallophosphoesterase n=2 Tax=Luteolibacter soli TaxID=3135280 RepID=A0ABU9ATS8_9BACT